MARSEARIYTEIWNDPDFLAMSEGSRMLFFFLISQSDLAHDGVIALRARRWSRTLNLTVAQVRERLAELEAARFVVVDEDSEELLIRSFIRRDKVYRQPNVLRAAADHLGLVESPKIRATIAVELRRVRPTEGISKDSVAIIDAMLSAIGEPLAEGIGNPSPDPSATPTPNPSGNPSGIPTPDLPGERGVVTAVSRDSPFPVPLSPDPVEPAPPAPREARETKRATRLPDDFAVTDEMKAWFAEHCPGVDGPGQTEKFIDYWRAKPGKDGTKLDWTATWRNWMRTAAERTGNGAPGRTGSAVATRNGGHHANPPASPAAQRYAEGMALADRLDAQAAGLIHPPGAPR